MTKESDQIKTFRLVMLHKIRRDSRVATVIFMSVWVLSKLMLYMAHHEVIVPNNYVAALGSSRVDAFFVVALLLFIISVDYQKLFHNVKGNQS